MPDMESKPNKRWLGGVLAQNLDTPLISIWDSDTFSFINEAAWLCIHTRGWIGDHCLVRFALVLLIPSFLVTVIVERLKFLLNTAKTVDRAANSMQPSTVPWLVNCASVLHRPDVPLDWRMVAQFLRCEYNERVQLPFKPRSWPHRLTHAPTVGHLMMTYSTLRDRFHTMILHFNFVTAWWER